MSACKISVVIAIAAGALLLTHVAGAADQDAPSVSYKTVFVAAVLKPAEQPGGSEIEVDGAKFAKDVQAAVETLARDGYTVESTIPVISGRYRWQSEEPIKRSQSASASAYGYGYSVTSGVTIVACKR